MKSRLEREKSNDTTSGGSNITVIEGHVPDESAGLVDICNKIVNQIVNDNNVNRVEEIENNKSDTSAKATNGSESVTKPSLPSCLVRSDSTRASVKKKVRCSETAEVIPLPEYFINSHVLHVEDDEDDVFSDEVPAQIPRGNMCTPYVERKGSLPVVEPLPDWFPNPRFMRLFIF